MDSGNANWVPKPRNKQTQKVVSPIDYHKWMSERGKKQQEKGVGNCFSRFLLQR
jgi:hypothetical protein